MEELKEEIQFFKDFIEIEKNNNISMFEAGCLCGMEIVINSINKCLKSTKFDK